MSLRLWPQVQTLPRPLTRESLRSLFEGGYAYGDAGATKTSPQGRNFGMGQLFEPTHPEFSDHLVHFTDRVNGHGWLAEAIFLLSARQRLQSILTHRTIWPTQPFGAAAPVVCFAEATDLGLQHLIGTVGYQPWGIVFRRQLVYDALGGPVFHYRPDEWAGDLAALPSRLRARFVRFEAGKSEWLWEREWRVVFEPGGPGFEFDPDDVAALIIGSQDWPAPVPGMELDADGMPKEAPVPPDWLPTNCELWWWNEADQTLEVL